MIYKTDLKIKRNKKKGKFTVQLGCSNMLGP